jgi:hypothetical protein
MEASREGFRLAGNRASGAAFMVEAAFMAAEVTGNFSRC